MSINLDVSFTVVSEGTSEVVEVITLSTTKSSSDENHREKLCKVLRISDGIPETKHNPFKSEISKFYGIYTKSLC